MVWKSNRITWAAHDKMKVDSLEGTSVVNPVVSAEIDY